MPTPADFDRRSELAESVADYFLAVGNCRSSLRDLSEPVGSSARMLLHYFETREALVDAALEVARGRQLQAASKVIAARGDLEGTLSEIWKWYRRADTARYFALFTDVAAFERSLPADERRFGARLGSDWRPMFADLFRSDDRCAGRAEQLAQLFVATIRGFALDLNNGARIADQKAAYSLLVDLALRSK